MSPTELYQTAELLHSGAAIDRASSQFDPLLEVSGLAACHDGQGSVHHHHVVFRPLSPTQDPLNGLRILLGTTALQVAEQSPLEAEILRLDHVRMNIPIFDLGDPALSSK